MDKCEKKKKNILASFQMGKTLGNDGILIQFYKIFLANYWRIDG